MFTLKPFTPGDVQAAYAPSCLLRIPLWSSR